MFHTCHLKQIINPLKHIGGRVHTPANQETNSLLTGRASVMCAPEMCKDSTTSKVPKLEPVVLLNNGVLMPLIGLGTLGIDRLDATRVVMDAIDIGYRHIDCARAFLNEPEIGEGIKRKLEKGTVQRKDLFISSKLWNTFHDPVLVEDALKYTLEDLRLSYLDLYLMHWPMAFIEHRGLFPVDGCGNRSFSRVDYVETWKAMERLVEKKLCRAIGVCNFNKRQLERILKEGDIPPVINQVECHPYLNQRRLMKFCKSNCIVLGAHSPLGSPDRPYRRPDEPVLLANGWLQTASQFEKSPGQLVIRYQLQRGNAVVPKSEEKGRLKDNLNVFDFEISEELMEELDKLDCNQRYHTMSEANGHPDHPFTKDRY